MLSFSCSRLVNNVKFVNSFALWRYGAHLLGGETSDSPLVPCSRCSSPSVTTTSVATWKLTLAFKWFQPLWTHLLLLLTHRYLKPGSFRLQIQPNIWRICVSVVILMESHKSSVTPPLSATSLHLPVTKCSGLNGRQTATASLNANA